MPETQPSIRALLYQKLHAVMSDVAYLQKDKENKFHGYRYASEFAVKTAVHASLVKNRLLFLSSVSEVAERVIEKVGKEGRVSSETLTTIRIHFKFVDIDSGECEEGEFFGTGIDAGDKGLYKAVTGALKYALTSWFLVATGDDAEADESEKRGKRIKEKIDEAEQYVSQKRSAQPTPPGDEPPPGPSAEKKPSMPAWKISMVKNFQTMKNELGEVEYRRILGLNGYLKSTEIPTREQGVTIYKEMGAALNDLKLKRAGNPADEFDRMMEQPMN